MAIPTSRSRNNKSRTNTSSSTPTSTASLSPSSHHPLLMNNNNNNNNPTLCPTTATAPYTYYTPQYFTASAHHVGAPILISTATATTATTTTTTHHNHHAFPIYPFQPIPLSHQQQQQQLYLPTITMNSATFDLMNNSDHDDVDNNNHNNKSHSHKNNHNKKNDKPSSVFLSCPSPKKEVHHHHNSTTPTVVTTPTTPTLMTLDTDQSNTDQSNTSSFLLLDTNNNNDNDNNNNSIDINNNLNNDVNNNDDDDGYYCCDSILNQEQFELQQQQPLDGEWNDVLMLIDNNSSETSPFISLTSSSLSSPSSNGSSHDNVGDDDDDLMMMRNISSEDDNDDGSPSLMAMMMDRDGYDEDDIVNDDEYLRALTHDHSSLSSENVVETATKKRRVSKSESVNVSSVSPSLSGDESSELSLSPSPVNSSSSSSGSSSNKRKREVSEEIDDERELNRLNQIPTSQLTDADKRLKKKLRNRQSARRSRENKKHELQVAQELNAQLTSTCTQLKHEVNDLKAKVQLLEKENEQLKLQLKLTNEPLKSDKSLFKNNVSKAKTVMLFSVLFCVGFLFHCLPSLFSSNTRIGSSTPALYNMPSSYGPMEASPSAMYPYHNRRGVNRQGMRLLTASPSSDNDEQKSQHQLPQHEEESISVEKEQTSQNESQFFNGEQMIKKQVVYPHPLKQHFSLGTKETLGTEKRLVSLPDTVESRILNDGLVGDFSLQNSKQLAMIPMALTHEASSAFLYNQMNRRGLEVGHTYQIPQERFIDDDASVRLICPYIYPLLNKNAPRGENMGNFRMQDLKNKYIKLLVPIQTINTDQGRRVVRMAEISARDISFGELYLEM